MLYLCGCGGRGGGGDGIVGGGRVRECVRYAGVYIPKRIHAHRHADRQTYVQTHTCTHTHTHTHTHACTHTDIYGRRGRYILLPRRALDGELFADQRRELLIRTHTLRQGNHPVNDVLV